MEKKNLILHLMFIALFSPAIVAMEPLDNRETDEMQIEETCSICLDEGPSTDFRQLGCSHRFCVECLKNALRLGLDEEWAQAMDTHLRCPKRGCTYQMNEHDIETISGDEARVSRYHELLTRLFINANRNFRRCPTRNCEVVYEVGPNAQTITCLRGCQASYCSHCREPHRQGTPCQEASAPIEHNTDSTVEQQQEQQYREWLRQNTKPCPQCNLNIQKNGGCNHMTCKNCSHEFCWQCSAQWRKSGQEGYAEFAQNHQGFYRCNIAGANAQNDNEEGLPQIVIPEFNHLNPLRFHQNVAELFNNEDPNQPELIHYARQNNYIDRRHALMINAIINPGANMNIQDRNQEPRDPLPILGAYFRQNRNNNNRETLERILNHQVNNNNNINGAEPQPLPEPHPIAAIVNQGAHPAPRLLNNNGLRDSHVNDAWDNTSSIAIFFDGEDYSARMNQFHDEEVARRNQNRDNHE